MFRKLLDEGRRGERWCRCCVVRSERRGAWSGAVLSRVRLRRTRSLKGSVRVVKDEGGRHTPFFKGYRPQFSFRTTDVTGRVSCRQVRRW